MNLSYIKQILITSVFLLITSISYSQIKLPELISDGIVLQRDSKTNVWGWASPGENITLTFRGKKYTTKTDENGNWEISLKPQKAGGPYTMTFSGKNEITIQNVLFGDVWLCTGQSNMVLPMERVKEKYPDEVGNANYPEIRNFFISTTTSLTGPNKDLPKGEWKLATSEGIMGFSATAYFFAKDIYEKYKIPIGIINASVGGTPIESWISEEGFKTFPKEWEIIQKNKDTAYINSLTGNGSGSNNQKETDKGLTDDIKWYENEYTPKGWRNINIPGFWEDQGLRDLNGVVWYRKEIDIPASMAGTPAKLFMGRIVDADFIYVNGTKVGNITYQYPPRRYEIPKGLLKEGKNTIVMRVLNYSGKGGFVPDKPYNLVGNGQTIDLKGTWQYKVGDVFKPFSGGDGRNFSAQNQPASLYNAMVAPVTKAKIKGILWYQGESNSGNPLPYYDYLPALIKDWRSQFNQGELPFLYVQLVNFMDVDYLPVENSNWAELRNAQLKALSVPNTAMAVGIDLGEWNDIHPLDKENVGKRLALGALKLAYGEKIVHSGPIYKSSYIDGDKIVINFDHIGGGLISSDGEKLRRFEIAGADKNFVWADARIEGNTVVVKAESVKHPEFVRYAWADNPVDANLYNKEGLPASPFRNYEPSELNYKPWQGKKAAVVLTYDDALNVHLDNAVPLLDSLNLKGTFYLTTFADGFKDRIKAWKRVSENGHELGNHTLFHPCDGSKPGREWVDENYDMSSYSLKRMLDEIQMTNVVLETLDGTTERTFAFTCGDMKIGEASFTEQLKEDFIGARAVRHEMHPIEEVDVYNIDSYMINGETGEEMIQMVKKAMESESLLVFLFHGVGGEHSLNVSLEAHRELLQYLHDNQHEIWVTTMKDAVKNINVNQH